MSLVIVGAQWGDEGKGKIVDLLAESFDVIIRFQGGNNAGHTVVVGDKTYKLHLIPSGIISTDKVCIMGNGMVIDPKCLLEEMANLEQRGCDLSNLYISQRAHVIMPYHKIFDKIEESFKTDKIGTTMRGIGPCYSDKVARIGFRIVDLLDHSLLKRRLEQILPIKEKIALAFGEKLELDAEEIAEEYTKYGEKLRSHIRETCILIQKLRKQGKKILLEGAQGTLLSIDHGTYPFVTSSNTDAGYACCGAGIGPRNIDNTLAVVKAYTSRVGEGPFPTELEDEMGELLRKQGREYGTTTGRPRRCGWLDLGILKYSFVINGIDEIALTKIDVLQNVNPIKICVGYQHGGEKLDTFPADSKRVKEITPIYEEMEGWQEDITGCRKFEDLPANCRKYIETIERILERPIRIISVGPGRNQTIFRS